MLHELRLEQLREDLEAADLDVRRRLARDELQLLATHPLDEVTRAEARIRAGLVPHALSRPVALERPRCANVQGTDLADRQRLQRFGIEHLEGHAVESLKLVVAIGDGVVAALVGGVDVTQTDPRHDARHVRAHLGRHVLACEPDNLEDRKVLHQL